MIDWSDYSCVIPCAGRNTRMKASLHLVSPPVTDLRVHGQYPLKQMIPLGQTPLLAFVIRYWQKFTDDFIFVVGSEGTPIEDLAGTLGVKARFAIQPVPYGIADAVAQVRSLTRDRFIVVLGDCLFQGWFLVPDGLELGIGVWQTDRLEDIRRSYSVRIVDGMVSHVIEKPRILENNLCGMGYYFFDTRVFHYIDQTPPSGLRHEVEITDVIQKMIDAGEEVRPVVFIGDYVNITDAADIQRAHAIVARAGLG